MFVQMFELAQKFVQVLIQVLVVVRLLVLVHVVNGSHVRYPTVVSRTKAGWVSIPGVSLAPKAEEP
jgi:hypothetical protein